MKRGTPDHPKMPALADRLNIPAYGAVGIMEMLWHFTARYCPTGDIGRWDNEAIARAVAWPVEDAERLIEALIACRWLDADDHYRLIVHDWRDHCDDATHLILARKVWFFADGTIPNLRRLARPEREAIEEAFAAQSQDETLCAQKAHRSAQDAHKSTLPKPKPKPEPEPEPEPIKNPLPPTSDAGDTPAPPESENGNGNSDDLLFQDVSEAVLVDPVKVKVIAPKAKAPEVEVPEVLRTDAFLTAWDNWQEYRREIRKGLKPSTAKRQLDQLASWGPLKAVEAIEQSIRQGWTGLFDPAAKGGAGKDTSYLHPNRAFEKDDPDEYVTPFKPFIPPEPKPEPEPEPMTARMPHDSSDDDLSF